jgi:hypothetical protein
MSEQRTEPPTPIDTTIQQRDGSIAARFERLLDLFAPMTEQPNGEIKRDPEHGVVSRETFARMLDQLPLESSSGGGK